MRDALRRSFRRVDDIILGVARQQGVRDGATALVCVRLGGALYAAHAGGWRRRDQCCSAGVRYGMGGLWKGLCISDLIRG